MPARFVPSGFFVLRTPLLPYDEFARATQDLRAPHALPAQATDASPDHLEEALGVDRARLAAALRDRVADPVVREALFIASPSLDGAIEAWLADPEAPRARGIVSILVRYLARMAGRPTPFGAFSGCSLGELGDHTSIELPPRPAYRRHTRLDMHYLATLCDALARDPAIRVGLRLRPSSGLYEAAGQLRYAEARVDPQTRALAYELASVERTDHLVAALAHAARGPLPADLAAAIVEAAPDVAREDAEAFVDELVDSQILVPDLAPVITGDEPIRGIVDALAAAGVAGAAAAGALASAGDALRGLDAEGLGRQPARYRAIAESLAPLGPKPELARLFHVDLYKPEKPEARAVLGGEVVRELERAVDLLASIGRRRGGDELASFRGALVERYGARLDGTLSEASTVPLVEALDDEAGIGFGGARGMGREPSPILDRLELPRDPSPPRVPFGAREEHMLRRIAEAERRGGEEWVLDDADLARLAAPTPAEPPTSFAVVASIAAASRDALARGEFLVLVGAPSGPSGAALLGRFCHGDPALRRAVEAHLRAEEAARPDAIFAEIVHLPEGRLGNVLCRPVLRDHEIPYLGRSGAPEDRRIPIGDLRVGLEGGRVALYSVRHGREVVPRLTSAHTFERSALGVYRFLGALQRDGSRLGGWTWAPFDRAPFLPRVSRGRIVVAPAQWNLSADQLAPLARGSESERYRAVHRLRRELGLPRRIGVAEGDRLLPVDLDDALHVESFVGLTKGSATATLVELFAEQGLVVEGPEGGFAHEIIVPFVTSRRESAPPPRPPAPRTGARTASVAGTFLPGSEWLYAKLYAGTAGADSVLTKIVAPVVAANPIEGWFFLRYGDPKWHVRARFRGDPRALTEGLLPALAKAASPLLADGSLASMQLDTYERETLRYGGAAGIELCESIFQADSEAVLAILELLAEDEAPDDRWRLALRGMHLLLLDLGFDLALRTAIAAELRAKFRAEHHVDAGVDKQLGETFRAERAVIEELLAPGAGSATDSLAPGFATLAARSAVAAPFVRELVARAAAGRLETPLPEIAAGLLHMHANRLLRAEHRAQELVLYDMLHRMYVSEAARARNATRTPGPRGPR